MFQTTKEDLLNFYNLDEKKIKVINHGHEHILNLTKKEILIKMRYCTWWKRKI